jgi:uncharacterized protein (TIGR02145 family)
MKIKKIGWIFPLLITGFLIISIAGCKKDETSPEPKPEPIPLVQKFTDIDGNVYDTVHIGTQIWLKQNLKVTRYRNGDTILNVRDNTEWQYKITGACCDYNNNATYSSTYGKIYNFYAIIDSRNIAPYGWHVPSDAEWMTLINYLGGDNIAADKLKETGSAHWTAPNTGASNESGFTALPGGNRNYNGGFADIENFGYWWSATLRYSYSAWFQGIYCGSATVHRDAYPMSGGLSIRCIKD